MYAYVVAGASLAAAVVVSLLQCFTCNVCGCGDWLDLIFAVGRGLGRFACVAGGEVSASPRRRWGREARRARPADPRPRPTLVPQAAAAAWWAVASAVFAKYQADADSAGVPSPEWRARVNWAAWGEVAAFGCMALLSLCAGVARCCRRE